LCDLERRIPLDVLPDRAVETVAAWFKKYPSIEVISRERSTEFATAPHLRSIEELERHLTAVRAEWFHFQLEEGGEDLRAFTTWGKPESPPRVAEELVSGLEHTWQVIQGVLGRYTLADLQSTVQDEWDGKIYTLTRGWVIWHVLQHDLHHGGEIAYSLGMHGLTAPSDADLYDG
jgi:uncharacterized damage-inducible protein DinB